MPPHPQHGSPAHRYVLLLLPQPSSSPIDAAETISRAVANREDFDLRSFIAEHSLLKYTSTSTKSKINANEPEEVVKSGGDAVSVRMSVDVEEGGGVAMWREQWDESVSEIYEKIIGKLFAASFPRAGAGADNVF